MISKSFLTKKIITRIINIKEKTTNHKKNHMPNPKIILPFFIAGLLYEAFFAIPVLGLITAWSSFGLYLIIGIILHVVIYNVAKKNGVPTSAPVVGAIANLLGLIPFIGNLLHIAATCLYLWLLFFLKDYFFNTGTSTTQDINDDLNTFTNNNHKQKKAHADIVHDAQIVDETPNPQHEEAQTSDDLTKIEGIGPKIATLLLEERIQTFTQLAQADLKVIEKILKQNRLASHNPQSWPHQAALARDGKWKELQKWQDEHNGSKA